MRTLAYFQPFSGLSGDMTLGALLDLGLPLETLQEGLRGLDLEGYQIVAEKVRRGALQATRARVVLHGAPAAGVARRGGRPGALPPEHTRDHSSGHSHEHAHDHPQEYPGEHRHGPAGMGSPGRRGLADILALLARSRLPEAVKASAATVFRRLGEAEAHVHGVSIDEVHFHEVGAVDSLVDITGSCLALHLLGVDEVHCGRVALGTGFTEGAHGRLPLPAPATLRLLEGFPVEQVESGSELTTPTGAALVTALARTFGPLPPSTVVAVGYGAGSDRPGPVPNVLRVILARREVPCESDQVVVLEAAVDDMSPEWLGHLVERLFEAGVLDAYVTPILMKKGRPGHEITVIAPVDLEEAAAAVLFAESTTFGLRRRLVERLVLAREVREVDTVWGKVRVKIGRRGGEEVSASVEFEDLRAAARRARIPLKEIHRRVLEQFHRERARSEPEKPPGG